jgi:predicted nucleic acid-binding protein
LRRLEAPFFVAPNNLRSHAAGREAARELLADFEREHGPLPQASRYRAREFLVETGLLAAERRNPDCLALHDELTSARIRPLVPVVVLAQAWRGGPQHQILRVLKGCDIVADDEHVGRAVGVACAASATSDVVDAIVVATAVRHQAPVVTSDPDDLTRIADTIGVKLRIFST